MTIIAANVSAHSVNWHCGQDDERGEVVSEFILRNDLITLNEEGQPSTHASGTNIDLTLITSSLSRYVSDWTVHVEASINDHRLITISINLKPLKDI